MGQVTVTIAGKAYRMGCEDGQEDHLKGLADRLDESIDRLRDNFGEIGDQRLIVMAAIMVMDETSEVKRNLKALEAEVAALREGRAALVERAEIAEARVARKVEDAAKRLEALAGELVSPPGRDGLA